jgi:tetratricopeptide (TPR) repeat protein
MTIIEIITGGIKKLTGTVAPTLATINESRAIINKALLLTLAQNRNDDQMQLVGKRIEIAAKMELMRQSMQAREGQKNKEFSLTLEAIEAETLIKEEKMRQAFKLLGSQAQREFNQGIEKFAAEVQIAVESDNITFQSWKAESDRLFTLDIRLLNAQIASQRDQQNHKNTRRDSWGAQRDQNSQIFAIVDDILQTVHNRSEMPLTVFFSPPVLHYDPAPNTPAQRQFPVMDSTLSSALRDLFKKYTLNQRSVKFMAGEWITKNRRAEAAVNQIFSELLSIPVLVLETEVEESFFNINIGFWNNDFEDARFETVVRRLLWQDAIGEIYQTLLKQEEDQEIPTDLEKYKISSSSRETLTRLQTDLEKYEINRRSRETFIRYIELLHCIHLGMMTDEYFLIYASQPKLPLLPTLLPDLFDEANLDDQACVILTRAVIDYCNILFDTLEKIEPAIIVELRLGWAKILQLLPSRYGFADQVQMVMQTWLKQRGITTSSDLITDIGKILTPQDADFVQSLNDCLQVLGQTTFLNIPQLCFQRGMEHLQGQRYHLARLDFNRTISMYPQEDAYYQRAIVCYQLKDYSSTITDLEQATALNPHRAVFYDLKGDTYLKLNKYEIALDNYNKAVSLGYPSNKRDALEKEYNGNFNGKKKEYQRHQVEESRHPLIIPLPNNQTLELLWIPGEVLKMAGGNTIQISEFRMGKYPITQAQYQALMGGNPAHFSGSGKENHPVESVNWNMAMQFCQKLTEYLKEQGINGKITLPSETQWEYACRAGAIKTTQYWFGDSDSQLKNHAWYTENSGTQTHSVKEKEDTHTNPWGLVDMHGNVWEWCADSRTANIKELPTNGSPYINTLEGSKSLRGGSWYNFSGNCVSGYRINSYAGSYNHNVGFRVIYSRIQESEVESQE